MKRTALRRKSLNPRRHKDPAVYAEYRDRWGDFDEAAFYLGVFVIDGELKLHWPGLVIQKPLEPHHLFSVSGQRLHLRSNLLMVTRTFHNWGHKNQHAARTIGILTKLLKRDKIVESEEFVLDEIEFVCGRKIVGIIGGYDFTEQRFRDWQTECVRRLNELKGGGG